VVLVICAPSMSTGCAGDDDGAKETDRAARATTADPRSKPRQRTTTERLVDLADTVAQVRSGVLRINVRTCEGSASGTGVMVSPRHVLTVEHVITDASRISLERSRNPLGPAEVIGFDEDRDLALLRVEKPIKGYVFRFAKRTPRLGEEVAALGYPLGLPLSVTRGTVSGRARTIEIDRVKRRALIQTDAAVNRGNSGGPLLAVKSGEVVGIVDLGSTELNGIAFAVSGAVASSLVNAWKAAPQPHPLERCATEPEVGAPLAAPPSDGGPRRVGVSAAYEGHFTSVDRLQRCYATDEFVFCSSGLSNKAVQLIAGGAVTDESPFTSRDVGGPSMPMGTAFATPAGTIRCDSSSRGVTCKDVGSGASFTIGDYRTVIRRAGGGGRGGRNAFSGDFTSVDRLERCFINADFVACTAGPSGKGVSLGAGGSAIYEGVTGSRDRGGPALGLGEKVTSGAITCDSSSRGITCTDRNTGNSFVIGDLKVRIRNDGREESH
jgi:V8-like Glu-specific endopeptidase